MKIGFFDSGIGGLSILLPILREFPHCSYLYLADQANSPYHTKSEEFIIKRSITITEWLISQNIDLLVVACNTATTIAVKKLRENFNIPIIGVEPALAQVQTSIGVTLLATKPTLESARTNELIANNNLQNKITKKSMPHWTALAETGKLKDSKTIDIIRQDLTSVPTGQTLVIACTHYIFFIEAVQKLRPDIKITDPRNGIIKQIKKYYETISPQNNHMYGLEIFSTAKNTDSNIMQSLLSRKISVKSISI